MYWRNWNGRMVISNRGRNFREAVRLICERENAPKFGDGIVFINIVLHSPTKRLMDLDNCLKGILDSLQKAGVINDDKNVYKITVSRGDVIPNGGVDISVSSLSLPVSTSQ